MSVVQAEYEKDRFRLPASLLRAAKQAGSAEPPKKKRKWGGSEAAANPVKEEDSNEDDVVLWRVNRDEVNKRLRYVGPCSEAACMLQHLYISAQMSGGDHVVLLEKSATSSSARKSIWLCTESRLHVQLPIGVHAASLLQRVSGVSSRDVQMTF